MGNSKMTQSSSLGNGRNKPIIEKGKLERRIHFRRKKMKENHIGLIKSNLMPVLVLKLPG